MNEAEIYQLVANALGIGAGALTAECGLNRNPAWDSLAHVQVILAIEKACGITVDDNAVMRYSSMKEIAKLATKD